MEQKIKFGNVEVTKVSLDKFEYFTDFRVTRNCSGKMKGLWALNTSMLENPKCQALSKVPDLVCHHCYAKALLGFRRSCRDRFARNYHAANAGIWKFVPDLGDAMFNMRVKIVRFEETGDLGSLVHAINYLLVALANPDVTFGFWSKHASLIQEAMGVLGVENVGNVSFVGSSYRLNEEDGRYARYPWIDHVFTVYTGAYADEHGTETNCAALSCFTCQRCYHKGGDFQIHEMLKADHAAKERRAKKSGNR